MDKFWLGFKKQASGWTGVIRKGMNKTVKNVDNALDYRKINAPAPPPIKQNTLDYASMKSPAPPPMWKQKMLARN